MSISCCAVHGMPARMHAGNLHDDIAMLCTLSSVAMCASPPLAAPAQQAALVAGQNAAAAVVRADVYAATAANTAGCSVGKLSRLPTGLYGFDWPAVPRGKYMLWV